MPSAVVAIGSGLLLAAARPPLDFGWLAFVALVPLLRAWSGASPRRAAALGLAAGAAYHLALLEWVRYFGAVAIVPFVILLSAPWAAVGATIAALGRRRLAHPAISAAVWVVGEGIMARWPIGGFSWGEIGYAFHDVASMRALGALGGLPLVSFVAVLVNACVASYLWRGEISASDRVRNWASVVLPAVALLAAGSLATGATHAAATLRIATIQGNDKNRDLTRDEIEGRYLPRTHFALAATINEPVDLIILPESSLDDDPRADPFLADGLAAIAQQHRATVLANAIGDTEPQSDQSLNLNVVYSPDGVLIDRYAKRHLVPFGEFLPLRSLLGRIKATDQVHNFRRGTFDPYFEVRGTRVVQEICFEIAFGPSVRRDVRNGADGVDGTDGAGTDRGDVLVVSTNNRSYRRSANSRQHLAISQMRAVETGRPVVQASISGITAFIDSAGRISQRRDLFENGVEVASVEARSGMTPYVRFGDWALLVALSATLVAGGAAAYRGRRDRRARRSESVGTAAVV